MRQIVENGESTRRQYALRGRAVALGWRYLLVFFNARSMVRGWIPIPNSV